MSKKYQTKTASAVTAAEVAVPERVTIAMTELAGAVEENLLALAVATGMQAMQTIMNEDVTAVCARAPRGRHDSGRRHGGGLGELGRPKSADAPAPGTDGRPVREGAGGVL